jgi:hypothetical protein
MIQSQSGPIRGDISQWQVESVQNVDIEMHHEMSMGQGRQRMSTSGYGVGDHLRASQPRCRHQAVHVLLVVAKADKSNVCGLEQWPSRADAGKLGNAAGQVEHVGDAHRVDDGFVWMVRRDHQVLTTVDIDQANFAVMLDQPCHRRDGQGALSAEH